MNKRQAKKRRNKYIAVEYRRIRGILVNFRIAQ